MNGLLQLAHLWQQILTLGGLLRPFHKRFVTVRNFVRRLTESLRHELPTRRPRSPPGFLNCCSSFAPFASSAKISAFITEMSEREQMLQQTLLLIPAYNEEQSIGALIGEIRGLFPDLNLLVINDASTDGTLDVLRRERIPFLNLPCNLGIGGAMQVGFAYAFEQGRRYAIRCDGDGQHPPSEIPKLVVAMMAGDADLVIGSRFLAENSYTSTALRGAGIRCLATLLSFICRARVTDPTSGFQMINRPLMGFFAHYYPSDYPEPEALSLLRRQGYSFKEVGASFRARTAGRSSIRWNHTWYYALKVALALVVDRARSVDVRYDRHHMEPRI